MTRRGIATFVLSSPLTLIVCANTAFALISERWPPIQADKAVTIAFPLALWAAYMTIELYHRIRYPGSEA